jgi:hypothetical protein
MVGIRLIGLIGTFVETETIDSCLGLNFLSITSEILGLFVGLLVRLWKGKLYLGPFNSISRFPEGLGASAKSPTSRPYFGETLVEV